MAGESVIKLGHGNFEQEVLKSPVPVLVDFWATWCGPCRMVAPVVDQLADEYKGKVKVGKVDVDENQSLAAEYKVMVIPTLCVFKDGKVMESTVGAKNKVDLSEMIEKYL